MVLWWRGKSCGDLWKVVMVFVRINGLSHKCKAYIVHISHPLGWTMAMPSSHPRIFQSSWVVSDEGLSPWCGDWAVLSGCWWNNIHMSWGSHSLLLKVTWWWLLLRSIAPKGCYKFDLIFNACDCQIIFIELWYLMWHLISNWHTWVPESWESGCLMTAALLAGH